jgi:hypothetical protein
MLRRIENGMNRTSPASAPPQARTTRRSTWAPLLFAYQRTIPAAHSAQASVCSGAKAAGKLQADAARAGRQPERGQFEQARERQSKLRHHERGHALPRRFDARLPQPDSGPTRNQRDHACAGLAGGRGSRRGTAGNQVRRAQRAQKRQKGEHGDVACSRPRTEQRRDQRPQERGRQQVAQP